MATSINVRLDDELETKLKTTINEMIKEKQAGENLSISNVVRGAIEKFISDYEQEKEGIIGVNYKINDFSVDEIKDFNLMIEEFVKLAEVFQENKRDSRATLILWRVLLVMRSQAINVEAKIRGLDLNEY